MIKVILALMFVLGLLLLTVYAIKYMGQMQHKNKFFKKISGNKRINVIEYRRIDAKHSIAIVAVDGKEKSFLLGNAEPKEL